MGRVLSKESSEALFLVILRVCEEKSRWRPRIVILSEAKDHVAVDTL
jgi:hypothetical protein